MPVSAFNAETSKFVPRPSKRRKKIVMMFGAVYRPLPDLGERWDGKLMLKVAHNKKVILTEL